MTQPPSAPEAPVVVISPPTDPVLTAIANLSARIERFDSELRAEMNEFRTGVLNQLADVGDAAQQAKVAAAKSMQIAIRVRSEVTGNSKPPSDPPEGEGAAVGAIPTPRATPLLARLSSTEGGLTDVIGQVARLEGKVDDLTKESAEVRKMNAAQTKAAGLTLEEGIGLATRAYTFLMSRDGVSFVVRMATLAGVAYVGFQLAVAQQRASQLPLVPLAPPAITAPAHS